MVVDPVSTPGMVKSPHVFVLKNNLLSNDHDAKPFMGQHEMASIFHFEVVALWLQM